MGWWSLRWADRVPACEMCLQLVMAKSISVEVLQVIRVSSLINCTSRFDFRKKDSCLHSLDFLFSHIQVQNFKTFQTSQVLCCLNVC